MKNRVSKSAKILIVVPKLILIENWKEEIKKWLDMGLFKNSKSPLVKATIADAIKKTTKKPWE